VITIVLQPQQAQLLFAVLGSARPTEALGDQAAAVRNALDLAHASAIQQIEAGLEAHQKAEQEMANTFEAEQA